MKIFLTFFSIILLNACATQKINVTLADGVDEKTLTPIDPQKIEFVDTTRVPASQKEVGRFEVINAHYEKEKVQTLVRDTVALKGGEVIWNFDHQCKTQKVPYSEVNCGNQTGCPLQLTIVDVTTCQGNHCICQEVFQ